MLESKTPRKLTEKSFSSSSAAKLTALSLIEALYSKVPTGMIGCLGVGKLNRMLRLRC